MINNDYYTTIDKNKLHIADESSCYGGNIHSYNHFLTRFFACLLGKAIKVDFNTKTRTVNKKDYERFLKNNGIEANQANIHLFVNFARAMEKRKSDWKDNGYMRAYLSKKKGDKLFKKLVTALEKGQLLEAKKHAGKGANLEKTFWEREGSKISFDSLEDYLPPQSLMKGTRLTPLLYSAKKGYSELSKFLIKVGANSNFEAETFQLKRTKLWSGKLGAMNHFGPSPYDPSNPHQRYITIQGGGMRLTEVILVEDKKKLISKHTLDENLAYTIEVIQ